MYSSISQSPNITNSINNNFIEKYTLSPREEMFAYEKLYAIDGMTFKKINNSLTKLKERPSILWNREKDKLKTLENDIDEFLNQIYENRDFIFSINNSAQFPTEELNNNMEYPVPGLYCKGNADLLDSSIKNFPYISIVGTRNISEDGRRRTKKLVKCIKDYIHRDIVIVSGLAKGVDTVALTTAMNLDIPVIAVIGTPINESYPKENTELQKKIAHEHLLISHVPFYRFKNEPFNSKRFHFTERNSIMAAISDVTIIVEASETSGTRTQARDCLKYNKPLFFLKSCYDTNQQWIDKAVEDGAKVLEDFKDLTLVLENL